MPKLVGKAKNRRARRRPSLARTTLSRSSARRRARHSRRAGGLSLEKLVVRSRLTAHVTPEATQFISEMLLGDTVKVARRAIRAVFPRLRSLTIDAVEDPEIDLRQLRLSLRIDDSVSTVLELDERLQDRLLALLPSKALNLLVVTYQFS
jgi:hypothetical protein